MVRVFLCWSGERSRRTAAALKEWLEMVFQGAHVFLSESTIKGGQRWQDELQAALEQSATGLCILNSENTKNQWIAFEAGSLAKTKDGRVTPILCGIGDGELKDGPLAQFQAKHLTRDGLETLAKELNETHGSPVPVATLERTLKAVWTPYGQSILEAGAADAPPASTSPPNPMDEVMVRLERLERSLPEVISEAMGFALRAQLAALTGPVTSDGVVMRPKFQNPFLASVPRRGALSTLAEKMAQAEEGRDKPDTGS